MPASLVFAMDAADLILGFLTGEAAAPEPSPTGSPPSTSEAPLALRRFLATGAAAAVDVEPETIWSAELSCATDALAMGEPGKDESGAGREGAPNEKKCSGSVEVMG